MSMTAETSSMVLLAVVLAALSYYNSVLEHHYGVIRVTESIRVTGQLVPGRVGSRVSTADPVASLFYGDCASLMRLHHRVCTSLITR